jgi:hypothetical protein
MITLSKKLKSGTTPKKEDEPKRISIRDKLLVKGNVPVLYMLMLPSSVYFTTVTAGSRHCRCIHADKLFHTLYFTLLLLVSLKTNITIILTVGYWKCKLLLVTGTVNVSVPYWWLMGL